MHLPRVAAVALITGAVVIVGGGPATADPGLATDAGGSIEAGRPTAHASYRQTPRRSTRWRMTRRRRCRWPTAAGRCRQRSATATSSATPMGWRSTGGSAQTARAAEGRSRSST